MELKEFIKQSVIDIIDSIIDLNKEMQERGAFISPRHARYKSDNKGYCDEAEAFVHEVEFNVMIENVAEKTKGGALCIKVISGSIGDTDKNIQGTNLKFSIPVIYPTFKFDSYKD
jgi:hypothetical protein